MPNQWKEEVEKLIFRRKNWVKSDGSKINGRKCNLKIKIYPCITGCRFEEYMQKAEDDLLL